MVDDDIKRELSSLGCSKHVVEGGLEYLIQKWRSLVGRLAARYIRGVDEFRSDLYARSILEQVIKRLPRARSEQIGVELDSLDEEFRRRTLPSVTAVTASGLEYWWNYRYPPGMYVPGHDRDSEPNKTALDQIGSREEDDM